MQDWVCNVMLVRECHSFILGVIHFYIAISKKPETIILEITLSSNFVWCIYIMWFYYCVSHFVNLYFFLQFLMRWLSTFILPGPKFYEYWYGSNNERKVCHIHVVWGQQALKLCFLNKVQIWGLPFVHFIAYVRS